MDDAEGTFQRRSAGPEGSSCAKRGSNGCRPGRAEVGRSPYHAHPCEGSTQPRLAHPPSLASPPPPTPHPDQPFLSCCVSEVACPCILAHWQMLGVTSPATHRRGGAFCPDATHPLWATCPAYPVNFVKSARTSFCSAQPHVGSPTESLAAEPFL